MCVPFQNEECSMIYSVFPEWRVQYDLFCISRMKSAVWFILYFQNEESSMIYSVFPEWNKTIALLKVLSFPDCK